MCSNIASSSGLILPERLAEILIVSPSMEAFLCLGFVADLEERLEILTNHKEITMTSYSIPFI